MKLTVYLASGAPCPWRLTTGLVLKGLVFERRYLEASRKEHKSGDYLALNPRGRMPTLVTGAHVLTDSIGALAWIERTHPDRPIFGDSDAAAVEIWNQLTDYLDFVPPATSGILRPAFSSDGALPENDAVTLKALNAAADCLHAELARLEGRLSEADFFCGTGASAADAVAFPEIRLIQRAVESKSAFMEGLGFGNLENSYPQLIAWRDRMAALPGMDQTMPTHW